MPFGAFPDRRQYRAQFYRWLGGYGG